MQAMIPAVKNFCAWAALQGGDTRSEFEFALSVVEWDREITLPEPTNPPVVDWHLETACGFSGETDSPARAVADAVLADRVGGEVGDGVRSATPGHSVPTTR